MPEISRFFGIVIKMFFDDHDPPHFHAEYGKSKALIAPLTRRTLWPNRGAGRSGRVREG